MLHVHGGEHVDLGFQQLHHIFVALGVLAPLDVGVGQLVDHDDGGFAGKDGVDVHLFKHGAFVFDSSRRNAVEFGDEFRSSFTAVTFNDTDHYIFATTGPPNRLA